MSYLEIAQQALRRYHARREMDQPIPPLDDPASEARRQRLLGKLKSHPALRYAVETKQLEDGSHIIAIAVPGATCELIVPVPRDGLEFARDLIAAMERAERRERCELSEKRGHSPPVARAVAVSDHPKHHGRVRRSAAG